jgi:hypothetical protein
MLVHATILWTFKLLSDKKKLFLLRSSHPITPALLISEKTHTLLIFSRLKLCAFYKGIFDFFVCCVRMSDDTVAVL